MPRSATTWKSPITVSELLFPETTISHPHALVYSQVHFLFLMLTTIVCMHSIPTMVYSLAHSFHLVLEDSKPLRSVRMSIFSTSEKLNQHVFAGNPDRERQQHLCRQWDESGPQVQYDGPVPWCLRRASQRLCSLGDTDVICRMSLGVPFDDPL